MTQLRVDNIHYENLTQVILRDMNFTLNDGQMLGLIGPNGAGKSTLLKIIANLLVPTQGVCTIDDYCIRELEVAKRAMQLGYLAQGAEVHWPLKVRRVIELGRLPYLKGRSKLNQEDNEAIRRAVEQTEVAPLLDRVITTLSEGERLRVLLTRLFATNPQIILADEPIASLDPYHQLHIMEILREHADNGGIVITVLHDLNHAARFCDELMLINKGEFVEMGTPSQVLSNKNIEQVYSIKTRQIPSQGTLTIIPEQRIPR